MIDHRIVIGRIIFCIDNTAACRLRQLVVDLNLKHCIIENRLQFFFSVGWHWLSLFSEKIQIYQWVILHYALFVVFVKWLPEINNFAMPIKENLIFSGLFRFPWYAVALEKRRSDGSEKVAEQRHGL